MSPQPELRLCAITSKEALKLMGGNRTFARCFDVLE
jgi:hypothetical protein